MPSDPKISIRIQAVTGRFRVALKKAGGALKALGRQGRNAGAEIDAGMSKARRGVQSISRQLEQTRNALLSLFAIRKIGGLLQDITSAAVEMEGLQASMEAVTGSSEAAAREFAYVRKEAQRLGLPLAETTRQYLGIMAAARGTKLEGEGVRKIFSAISEAAVVLNMSNDDLAGSLLAVQQIISKGTVSAEELRQQLGERLYGAFQIAARSIGIATKDLNKALQQGLLRSDQFLLAFAAQIHKEFGGSVEEASQTARAELARFQNAIYTLKIELARSGFLDEVIHGVKELTAFLKKPQTREAIRGFGHDLAVMARAAANLFGKIRDLQLEYQAITPQNAGGFSLDELKRKRAQIQKILDGWGISDRLRFSFSEGFQFWTDANLKAALAKLDSEISRRMADAARKAKQGGRAISAATGSGIRESDSKAIHAAEELRRQVLAKLHGRQNQAKKAVKAARAALDAELTLLQDGLQRQSKALENVLEDRLISIRDYYRRKADLERQAVDAEIAGARRRLALAREAGDKQAVIRLEAELIRLSREREAIAGRAAREQARAERELADAIAMARRELARITGTETADQRREAVAMAYRDLRARLLAEGDTAGVSLIDRLIDVKAAQANLDALESKWRLTAERMRNAQEAIRIQQQAGLLTEAQAREQIVRLQQQSAAEMEKLLPLMEQAARAIGPEAVARVQAWKNELARTKLVADEVAVRIKGQVQNAFATMFEQIGSGAKSAKEAFRDFARSVIASINRIAAQKLAQSLFGSLSGSIGGFVGALFKGFAAGGYVSGPGTSTSDSIPARLSAGEYVINAASVKRVGVAFLDAINGGAFAPRWRGPNLAFAAGGLATNAGHREKPQVNVRVVNAVDESLVGDFLATPAGEQVITNVIRRNAATIRQYLGD